MSATNKSNYAPGIGILLISMFSHDYDVKAIAQFIAEEKLTFKFEQMPLISAMAVSWKKEKGKFVKIHFNVKIEDVDKLKAAIRFNKIKRLNYESAEF